MAKSKSATLTSRAGTVVYTGKRAEIKPEDNPAELPVQTPRRIVRHPEFFFDNTLVAVQIEDTLFNVHKYQLIKSEVFSDMFKMPKTENDEPEEGSSPENPIVIEGVAASDFAALLKVLYASLFSSHQPSPEALLIIPAFRLANMFNFSELRAHLLPLAEKSLNDVDRIVFAKEFSIKQWLAPAYVRLCQREERLSIEEARKLDVDADTTAMTVLACRQIKAAPFAAIAGPKPPTCIARDLVRLFLSTISFLDPHLGMAKKKPTKPSSRDASWMFIDGASDVKSDDEESSTESAEPLEQHPEFFFDNTLIAIQIGKTLFNVHKYQLAKSQVFSDRFKRPRQGDEPEEGLTPELPIKLKGVSASEFAALLRVLYARYRFTLYQH
ncbi:unnamed protein product [Rhizoctonia solani]|uniref:BTB domain-containing protein n=1 Tax=Rhizoctonia solani TaxID=456999 RepID=A0A8H2Y4W8_9AGAM|nr:unnamed protein product [Rhizoctonia solani]